MADTETKPAAKPAQSQNGPRGIEVTSVKVGPEKLTPAGVDALAKARAARKPADPNESRSDKFRRLANHRVPRVLAALAAIESLANKSAYEFTDEQSDKIVAALDEAVKTIRNRFKGAKATTSQWSL